ncbi:MAG: hypothetical protein KGI91_00085 [Burkholderiales bacterium]|nr:hypothetical protein [Burkholderiales bacterium]MDE2431230.1 hypothetical protein [Burkholderiales bacterium]
MNRHSEQQLLNFCLAQHGRFNPDAWRKQGVVAPDQTACAMLLLADARWYGRWRELQALMGQSQTAQAGRLTELSRRVGFNPRLFAQRLQALLWQSTEAKR